MSAGESLTQAVQTILARKHQTRIRRIDHAMFALVLVSLALMVTWQTVTVPEARLAVEAGTRASRSSSRSSRATTDCSAPPSDRASRAAAAAPSATSTARGGRRRPPSRCSS